MSSVSPQSFTARFRLPGGDWQPIAGPARDEAKANELLAALRAQSTPAEYELVPAGGAK